MIIRKIKVPTSIRFDTTQGYFDSLPDAIKAVSDDLDLNSVVIAFEGDSLWVLFCRRYVVYTLSEFERFLLWYFTPGKGTGFIFISANHKVDQHGGATLARFSDYTDRNLDVARRVAGELEDILGYVPEEQNHGPYC